MIEDICAMGLQFKMAYSSFLISNEFFTKFHNINLNCEVVYVLITFYKIECYKNIYNFIIF